MPSRPDLRELAANVKEAFGEMDRETLLDILTFVGTIGIFLTLFMLFLRFLPAFAMSVSAALRCAGSRMPAACPSARNCPSSLRASVERICSGDSPITRSSKRLRSQSGIEIGRKRIVARRISGPHQRRSKFGAR